VRERKERERREREERERREREKRERREKERETVRSGRESEKGWGGGEAHERQMSCRTTKFDDYHMKPFLK
jgi:hypothetical protein